MLLITLMMAMLCQAMSHPASCTEDTQCPSDYYCEESAHVCRECLRCADLKREAPQPRAFCARTVTQCGPCFDGYSKRNAECEVDGGGDTPPAYLPAYAWAAVVVALLLMLLTLAVILKMKPLKFFDYSSRTSVHSLRATEAAACQPLAPPPYNCVLPSSFPPSSPYAPQIQQIADPPLPCKNPVAESPPTRAREASASQAARVYNHPAYVRVPQSRCNVPEDPMLPPEDDATAPVVSPTGVTAESTQNDRLKLENDLTNIPDNVTNSEVALGKAKDQDSNNNCPSSESSQSTEREGAACRPSYFIGGPSFVINVVENIANVVQANGANLSRNDTS